MLGNSLPAWLYSHPHFLKFHFHMAEGTSIAGYGVCFHLFFFFLSDNKKAAL